jgi:hypothetical protein
MSEEDGYHRREQCSALVNGGKRAGISVLMNTNLGHGDVDTITERTGNRQLARLRNDRYTRQSPRPPENKARTKL